MERIRTKKKRKFTRRKLIVIISFIAIFIGVLFLINRLIPIKNISKDNINIKLSTTKPTGKNVIATITTKTKYNIFYFIDYSAGEEQYYEDQELSEDIEELSESNFQNTNTTNSSNTNSISNLTNDISNNSVNNTSSNKTEEKKLDIKQISDKEYKKVNNSKFEIEDNGIVYLKYERFGKLSSIPYVFEISNIDKTGPEIIDVETSSTLNSITVTASAIDQAQEDLQYYFKLDNDDTYISTGSTNSYTFKNLVEDESYIIYVKVTDKFGNASEAVAEATASLQTEIESEEKVIQKIYHFKVNLGANTVTVYEKDEDGKFTKAIKAFVCSTGKSTPKSGTYKISNKYRWRSLFGNVYGQYAVRITGNILFHSVPYEKMYPNTLEYEEYDKLGTSASMGCIRLCVRDAKWIYDNAKAGSTVEFYSNASNPGPLGKPKAQKISGNKANRNWDPTDPDKHNPWLGGDGKVSKPNLDDGYVVNNSITNNTTNNTKNTVSNSTEIPINNEVQNNVNTTNSVNNNTTNNQSNSNHSSQNETSSTNTVTPPTNTTVEPPNEDEPDFPPTQNTITPPNNNNSNTTTTPNSNLPTNNVEQPSSSTENSVIEN